MHNQGQDKLYNSLKFSRVFSLHYMKLLRPSFKLTYCILNKRLKYVGIYLNLWNWILSPYERVPKKHQCQDALCTLCKAHTFVQFLNTKMVGKTANITLHWRGSWENTPHDSDRWTAGFSFSIALFMLVNQRENLIFDHDLLQSALFHFTWYAMSAA